MDKYKVTFMVKTMPFAAIEVYAYDYDGLASFIDRFYPATNWDYWDYEKLCDAPQE